MSPGPGATLGLRERKKLQTRQTIERVALQLFAEQGFAATTIPQIAEAADVSPRTVSSYFPAKEDLVFSESIEVLGQLRDHLSERSGGETTAHALRRWIEHEVPRWDQKRETGMLRRQIVEADPSLQAHARHFLTEAEALLTEQMAADLGCPPDALEARMAAAATLAVFQAIEVHREQHACQVPAGDWSTEEAIADALALLDRALLFITGGIQALRGDA